MDSRKNDETWRFPIPREKVNAYVYKVFAAADAATLTAARPKMNGKCSDA